MPTRPTTSVKLDEGLRERLHRLAQARRRSPHWVMREAIEQYVNREEKREQFLREAMAAWNEYAATGLHLSGVEVDRWLARLEAGEDIPAPECHD